MSDVQTLPRIDITEDMIAAGALETRFSEKNRCMGVIDSAKVTMTDDKQGGPAHISVQLGISVLDPDNTSVRAKGVPRCSLWLALPLERKDDGYSPPKWARDNWIKVCEGFFSEEYLPMPHLQKDGQWYVGLNVIEPGEVVAFKNASSKSRLELAKRVVETQGTCLLQLTAYGTCKTTDSGFQNFANIGGRSPKNGLTPLAKLLTEGAPAVPGEKKEAKPANGNGSKRKGFFTKE